MWRGSCKSEETFLHIDMWKKTMCLFDMRVVTGKGCFCPLCPINHRWGEIFNLPDLQQHCLWPLLLIAVEQNGLVVQTTPPPPLLHPLMVSAPWRLSVFQGWDGLKKTEGTLWWKERERMGKRCMDRWVWSGSSQPWWRLMGGWGDKSWEGGGEGVFVRGSACWKPGMIDGERGYGEVSQDYVDMTITTRGLVAKWRRARWKSQSESGSWKGEIRWRRKWWWWELLVTALFVVWGEKKR